jgi:shikimate 5-dehydrogenase
MIDLSPAARIVMVASGLPGKHTRDGVGYTVHQLANAVGTWFPLHPVDSAIY